MFVEAIFPQTDFAEILWIIIFKTSLKIAVLTKTLWFNDLINLNDLKECSKSYYPNQALSQTVTTGIVSVHIKYTKKLKWNIKSLDNKNK